MLENLQRSIQKVADEYVSKLKKHTPKDSGALKKSIKALVNDEGFEVDSFEYLDYLDKGVDGTENTYGSKYSYGLKKPPIKSLREWSNKRGLNVWAVQNSLYKKGLKPRNFISKADTQVDFNEITEAYSKDIDEQFNF